MKGEREERLTQGLLRLHGRKDMSQAQRDVLLDAANAVAWDDAIHIAAPWEPRSSLCGNWNRNLVALTDERPDGVSGCWTCLLAADWLSAALPAERTGGDLSAASRTGRPTDRAGASVAPDAPQRYQGRGTL